MTRIKSIVSAFIVAIILVGCENPNENVTESGLAYNYITKGTGEVVEDGQFLILNMVYKDNNDSSWMDTEKSGFPIPVMKRDSVWKTQGGKIEEIFSVLKKGDSVNFEISVKDFYEGSPGGQIPPTIDSLGHFTFYIGVGDVISQDGMNTWQQEMIAKQTRVQQVKDEAIIDEFLSKNNIEAQKTESGLRYVITQEGSGDNAVNGDSVRVAYVGKLLDGTLFDTSVQEIAQANGTFNPQRPYAPYKLKLGVGSVIKGWDEGLTYLNEGSKATLYIPSTLAYGPRSTGGVIGANAVLMFDVELVEIIRQ